MARQQIYRGNPELKQSVIFDNFSGGINTTDIDDQMLTNEFRLLRNVELLEKGRIQNRKGFSNLVVFNEWLTDQVVSLPSINYYMFYPLLDEYSTFNKMKEYQSFVSFKDAYETMPINMMFAIAVRDGLNIKFYELSMIHVEDTFVYTAELTLIHTVVNTSLNFTDIKLTGINVEAYDGKYYIMLNNINKDVEGIAEFYQEDGNMVLNIYNRENSYIPNPYEISNIGFNLLSNNPTQHIKADSSLVEEIRSVFLTAIDDDNLVLSSIPISGRFKLNVIYKGTEDLHSKLRVKFYTEDDFGEKKYIETKIYLKNLDLDKGVLGYIVTLSTSRHPNIFIEITKPILNEDIPYSREFDSLSAAIDFYTTLGTSKILLQKISPAYARYYVPDGVAQYGYRHEDILYNISVESSPMQITGNSQLLPYISADASDNLTFTTTYPDLKNTYSLFIVKEGSVHWLVILYVNHNGEPTSSWVYDKKKNLGNTLIANISDYTLNEFENIKLRLQSEVNITSHVSRTSNTAYDVSITSKFLSQKAAENYILANYNTQANSGNIFRVSLYTDENEGLCFINEVGDLTYTTEATCTADGGVWYVPGENIYLLFTYVDETQIIINYDFYKYNGGNAGTAADFTKADVELTIDALTFTTLYPVRVPNDKPIEPIDLKNSKHIIIQDRLFLYSGNTIIASDTYSELDDKSFSYFPNYNYIILSLEANDTIQKIAYFRGSHLIFTKKKIYRMSGTFGQEDFIIVTINDALGCVAPESVRSINNTLIFMSEDGLYTVKQNFYQEGLENVDKIDRQVKGIVPRGTKHESILYNEQYMLFVKDEDNKYLKTVKQYYNMQYVTKTYPYVVDEYVHTPNLMFKVGTDLNAIRNGQLWTYDIGYTDFAPVDATELEIEDYTYKWTVLTPYWTVGYPLHEKKFKNLFIKLDSDTITPVYFTIYVDKLAFSTSFEYLAKLNEFGEVEYYKIVNPVDLQTTVDSKTNIVVEDLPTQDTLDPDLVLGDFELGRDTLNETKYQVHKILLGGSAKGKSLAIQIEQKKNSYFGLDSIGLVYKLNKMRESR